MVCNTGVGLTPRHEGEVLTFQEQGLYDGLFLMADRETGTYWSHLTGEALYGPLAGERIPVENVLHTSVRQVLDEDPETLVALSEHPRASRRAERGGPLARLLSRVRGVPDIFPGTMGAEDERRPRMDMGIGLWTESGAARYYPLEAVEARGRALPDTFDGRRVLVYYDPNAYALLALHVDADRVSWDGDVLHLSGGERIENGLLLGPDGERLPMERPQQVFTRWYGFSLTFPEAEIYQPGR